MSENYVSVCEGCLNVKDCKYNFTIKDYENKARKVLSHPVYHSGNDLFYRGSDVLDISLTCKFKQVEEK